MLTTASLRRTSGVARLILHRCLLTFQIITLLRIYEDETILLTFCMSWHSVRALQLTFTELLLDRYIVW